MTKRYSDYQEVRAQQAETVMTNGTIFDLLPDAGKTAKGIGPAPVMHDQLKFMLAGKATFTIVSVQTGKRYTYVIQSSDKKWTPDEKNPRIWWVRYLYGPDNESSYRYLATIKATGAICITTGSHVDANSEVFKAIKFVYDFLRLNNRMPNLVELHHAGKCGRCGRKLTVPESITSGFGPECRGKV